ncbi:MAG: glycosyltransferase [Castellaniella sp.]|uniref:glycosyltransferase family 4 protein n=1 Tax=Castellaniella sp. TaxID=1955812 RepID=UPI0012294707|nr:glycosyltransferase family 4 protein [Castellaniella sp.]TAN27575.1 MAG: glycosyltransferase [Castellaniella sp.]
MKRYFVVAGDIRQVTGGYRYDARMVEALRRSGRPVEVIELAGTFPGASGESADALDSALARCKDDACVILDGLVSGGLPQVLVRHAGRLRLVALIHHPLADEVGLDAELAARYRETERQALAAVARVVVSSPFTARRLADVYGVLESAIDVVEPGVDPVAGLESLGSRKHAPPSILCVATLVPRKGHEVLVQALSQLLDLDWSCDCVGDAQRDPACTRAVLGEIARHGLGDRVRLRGILAPEALEHAYAHARLFVLPSWYEGYGMVVAEALQHGLPVVSTTGGALAQTLPPQTGIAVLPGDASGLAVAMRRVLTDPVLCESLSAGARTAAASLPNWEMAGMRFVAALDRVGPCVGGEAAYFASAWLALREPVDHRSRAHDLAVLLSDHLQRRTDLAAAPQAGGSPGICEEAVGTRPLTPTLVDLGAGDGSNMRYLSDRLPQPLHWRLLDHDARLLSAVRGGRAGDVVDCEVRDLAVLSASMLAGADVVTASALLDLVSADWLKALCEVCASAQTAVLMALSIDGRVRFSDDDPMDASVGAWVAQDQQRDKGLGPALGAMAPVTLAKALEAMGYDVSVRPSDWHLDRGDADLGRALIDGWRIAAQRRSPSSEKAIAAWAARRIDALVRGELSLTVGHVDVLGLPARARIRS